MNFSKLVIICTHIPLVGVCLYAFWYYTSFTKDLRVFSYFIFLSALVQVISLILWFKGMNNMILLHLYVPLGFIGLMWFYNTVLKGYLNPVILKWVTGLFLIFTLANSAFFQDVTTFNSYALTAESVVIVMLSLSTFSLFMNKPVKMHKRTILVSLNWINSGLFIYHASNLLLFYFGKSIMHFSVEMSRYSWLLHSFFFCVMSICFFVGLWKRPEN